MSDGYAAAGFRDRAGAALVVGGTGGVGSAVVRLLARQGSRVAFTYRSSAPAAADLAAEASAAAHRLDLADHGDTATIVDAVAAEAGGLHTLVFAAGPKVPQTHLSRVEPATFSAHLEAEAGAFFAAARAALPHLRRAGGVIIAVTTAATDRFAVRDGLSTSPKAAIEALVRGLAAEEGRFEVRVNAVGPGMLGDGMAEQLIVEGHYDDRALEVARANIALRRFGTCADVAEAVCFLASDRAGYISGQILNVDGGYTV